MTANQIRQKIVNLHESREQIAFKAGVSYSWLSKFCIKPKPGTEVAHRASSLAKLEAYLREYVK